MPETDLRPETTEEKRLSKRPVKQTRADLIREALGLAPGDIQEIEKKISVAYFLDLFSQETLNFIYKDRSVSLFKDDTIRFFEGRAEMNEEDKILKKSFEDKQIINLLFHLKVRAEEMAYKAGYKQSVEKKLSKIRMIFMIPMMGIIFLAFIPDLMYFALILMCFFCIAPQMVSGSILKKWFEFKEQHKNQFYEENRDEILILKDYIAEILDNIRSRLIEMKFPFQLIKFILHSRDYENLNVLNQRTVRDTTQYFVSFEYPEGMEPFPIPDILKEDQSIFPSAGKMEKNFVVLTEIQTNNGVIIKFIPTLRSKLAATINKMLDECEFSKSPLKFKEIIPNYSSESAIYCLCGQIIYEFGSVQICNWKDQFKFYLFISKSCNCGEEIYVLSLMDEKAEIPEEFKPIFSS